MDEIEYKLAYFIWSCSIQDSIPEIINKIKSKFGIKVSYSSVARFRKNLPKMQKLRLEKSRDELIPVIQFVIDHLKSSIKNPNTDNNIRLKLITELREFAKFYNELLSEKLKSIDRKEPF